MVDDRAGVAIGRRWLHFREDPGTDEASGEGIDTAITLRVYSMTRDAARKIAGRHGSYRICQRELRLPIPDLALCGVVVCIGVTLTDGDDHLRPLWTKSSSPFVTRGLAPPLPELTRITDGPTR